MPPVSPLDGSGVGAVIVSSFMLALSTLTLLLRVASRWISRHRYTWDDYVILAAYIIFVAYIGTYIQGIRTSGGTLEKSKLSTNLADFDNLFLYTYVLELLFTIIITLVKISILLFYWQVFQITQRFRQVSLAVGALCLTWFFVCFFVDAFQCNPPYAEWNFALQASGQATCLNYGHFIIGYETSNIVLDIAILSLPIWMLRGLQLEMRKKVALGAVFMTGAIVVIVSCVRVAYLANVTTSLSDNTLPVGLDLSAVELAVAIACANMPTMGPLLKEARIFTSTGKGSYPLGGKKYYASDSNPKTGSGAASKRDQWGSSHYDELRSGSSPGNDDVELMSVPEHQSGQRENV